VANLLMGGPVTADTICALLEQRQIAGTIDAADDHDHRRDTRNHRPDTRQLTT
jgi:hypothetical protein